jgi:sortase A
VKSRRTIRAAETLLWCAAAILLGCYGWVYLDRSVYQAFQSWSFDRALERKPAPAPAFVLHVLAAGGTNPGLPTSEEEGNALAGLAGPAARRPHPLPPGALIGRIEIPRIGVRAMIANGTTASVLRRAVGHIEGTPPVGGAGNAGLAGHRDTLFRGLRNIGLGDRIEVKTLQGTYRYVVEAIRIVAPGDTGVLAVSARPTLTLITCYPFDYVGAAPRRFVVQAREVTPRPPPGS